MRTIWKITKILSAVIGSVVALILVVVIGLGIWIINYPRSAWNTIEKHVLPKDMSVTWDSLNFDINHKGLKDWTFSGSTFGMLIKKENPEVYIPIQRMELEFGLNMFHNRRPLDIEIFLLNSDQPWKLKFAPSKTQKKEQNVFQQMQTYLDYYKKAERLVSFQEIDLHVPEIDLASTTNDSIMTIFANAKYERTTEDESPPIAIQLAVKQDKMAIDLNLNGADVSDKNLSLLVGGDVSFINPNLKIASKFDGGIKDDSTQLKGLANIDYKTKNKPIQANPRFNLNLEKDHAELTMAMALKNIPGPLIALNNMDGQITLPLTKDRAWSEKPLKFNIRSPVDLFFVDKDMRPPLEKSCHCKIPERVLVKLEGQAWIDKFSKATKNKEKALEAALKVESVNNRLFTSDIAANLDVFREGEQYTYEPRTDARLVINSFQGLRQFLDAKNIMIPAPFDVLEGTVTLTAKGPVSRTKKSMRTDVNIRTDLSSENQKVDLSSLITLDLTNDLNALNVDVDGIINTLRAELPPLDPVFGLPPVTLDKRINFGKKSAAKPRSMKVSVSVKVRTKTPGAIQLLSNLADPYVPVSINFNSNDISGLNGYVRLEPFQMNYLRRTVNVETLSISMAKDEDGNLPLVGRFRVEQGGYRVYIALADTVQSPEVILSSEPYLPRDDIISVLLYGHVREELVGTDAENVGGVDAAIADKAIGLFGLWAFASTPIQSFSYNPVTKVYSAAVQVGKGVTASIGSNWESGTHFELRKRVSRRWVLTASWAPADTEEANQEGKLVLQWEHRF